MRRSRETTLPTSLSRAAETAPRTDTPISAPPRLGIASRSKGPPRVQCRQVQVQGLPPGLADQPAPPQSHSAVQENCVDKTPNKVGLRVTPKASLRVHFGEAKTRGESCSGLSAGSKARRRLSAEKCAHRSSPRRNRKGTVAAFHSRPRQFARRQNTAEHNTEEHNRGVVRHRCLPTMTTSTTW